MFRSLVASRSLATRLSGSRSFHASAVACRGLVVAQLEDGIATITMQNPPVNSLSLEMFEELSLAVKSAESDPSIQALVLQSSNPKIFSAGLDLAEMHQPNHDRIVAFWHSFQQLYLDLYGSRLACIAAIEGHAPAAGCMLALSCDYRIMNSNPKLSIGLNESQLGIAAPPWLADQLMDTIGKRQAELAMSLGTLFSPQEAFDLNLVDELVDEDKVRDLATKEAKKWAKIPPSGRLASKMLVRKPRLDHLVETRQHDTDHFVNFVTDGRVQKSISAYLELLASKKKKK